MQQGELLGENRHFLSEGGRELILYLYQIAYQKAALPLVKKAFPADRAQAPQMAHDRALQLMAFLDGKTVAQLLLSKLRETLMPERKLRVGEVELSQPLILAAGWVKGMGFESEAEALTAVEAGKNIIPGWQTMGQLGPVEFGSYTRYPRLGNPGQVLWRHESDQSLQNRVGLKNPGAKAAAEFLSLHLEQLPEQFGINLAVQPGVESLDDQRQQLLESVDFFLSSGVFPSWFTLNLSCPNTEDDPKGHQTTEKFKELAGPLITKLRESINLVGREIPLWIKVSPDLSDVQYNAIMDTCAELGVKAIIATNTLAAPAPGLDNIQAGLSGGGLHEKALEAAKILMAQKEKNGYDVDVIGSGGINTREDFESFQEVGVEVGQFLSSLIYQGPLASAVILNSV